MRGRILYDVTKASRQKHKSGLLRVSECLIRDFGKRFERGQFLQVVWDERKRALKSLKRDYSLEIGKEDIFLTSELFCEYEREGIEDFIKSGACRSYAIFHDAIPMQHPEFTWPHSVQRHPSYMKMLALFDGVFAVSQHSSMLLEEYWEWLGYEYAPSVKSLQLGADGVFDTSSPPQEAIREPLRLLVLGILEKRKGQDLALQAVRQLWSEGFEFEIHFVGRANPHYGREIAKALKSASSGFSSLHLHGQIDDCALQAILDKTDLALFPSRAEGCGLPVLESLWRGIPVLSSDLASVRESSRFGGCKLFKAGDASSMVEALRDLLADTSNLSRLAQDIRSSMLPRWSQTVNDIVAHVMSEEIVGV